MLAQRGAGRPSDPSRSRRPGAPSLFVVAGLALVVLTFVPPLWLVVELAGDSSMVGGGSGRRTVDFATPGFVAVTLGWAAFARSYPRAVLRTSLALVAMAVVPLLMIAFFVGFEVYRNIQDDEASFQPTAEYDLNGWAIVDPAVFILFGLVVIATPAIFGLLARAGVAASPGVRDLAGGAVLLAMVVLGALHLFAGDGFAAGVGVASVAWLAWALQRARARVA